MYAHTQDLVLIMECIRSGRIYQIELILDANLYMNIEEWHGEMVNYLGTKNIIYQLPFPVIALLCSRVKDLSTVMDLFPKFPWKNYV